MPFARAVIDATLDKLAAGVSVEPDYQRLVYKATGGDRTPDPEDYRDYYTLETLNTAIAAARVQALKEVDRLLFAEKQFRAVDIVRALINPNLTTGEMK